VLPAYQKHLLALVDKPNHHDHNILMESALYSAASTCIRYNLVMDLDIPWQLTDCLLVGRDSECFVRSVLLI
jgi:hypothetical protein